MTDTGTQKTDSFGSVDVPKDAYWGPQTQRAINHFAIGQELMPLEVIHAYASIKQACAHANFEQSLLTEQQFNAISEACEAIYKAELDDQFPLSVWQTGSGTQTNMNVNEVISHYANESLGKNEEPLHPNDDINAQQSSNDTFPTAMHIALCKALILDVLPTLVNFKSAIENKIQDFEGIIRIGRTHLQDAVPISLAQSFSAYHHFITEAIDKIHQSLDGLYELPLGGTAVGTGINSQEGFAELAVNYLAQQLNMPFVVSENPSAILSSHTAVSELSGHLATLATNLNKMANDIRLLGSGPRCGIGELTLPANEPGSSIMPGKVNPTQCEALSQVCLQVMANHQLVLMANSQGHLELNTYKPVMIHSVLQSCQLINDSCQSFKSHLLEGLKANPKVIENNVARSLMLITALKPIIGYDNCSKIATHAHENNLTLKEAASQLGLVSEAEFDEHVDPTKMV
ncbi:MAG: class II fumarate hydratase [Pseudomonadota bacterium]|nr:class II fumarate hydratase [Pseudomonadota bacterium]